jgi:hypothetical protein
LLHSTCPLMAPSGAIHPLGSAFLTICPPTRAFYDEDDTGKGSSGNGVLLKVADPVIRRVTTRPQWATAAGTVPRYRCTTNGCPREVFAHNASRLLRPGWSAPAPRITAPLEELAHSGRTLHRRRHDVLAYFDHNASNGRPHRKHQRPVTGRYFAMGTNCRCSRRATSTTSRSN